MSHLAHLDSGTFVLELPWSAPPLTLNMRLHYRAEAELRAEIRTVARDLATQLGLTHMVRPSLTLVWLVASRHRRDEDNIVPTLKSLADGLVDAGVAIDDTPELMGKAMPIIAYAKGHPKAPGMFLVVWDQPDLTAEQQRAIQAVHA